MPRTSRPTAALVLAAGLAGAACGDPTVPSPPGGSPGGSPGAPVGAAPDARLLLAFETAPGDTAAQVGVSVAATRSDSASLRELRVYVDSASQPEPAAAAAAQFRTPVLRVVAFLGGPGRHTITVAVTDTAGRTLNRSFTRTVTLDSVAYTAAALPDLGNGASPEFIHPATGAVAGSVTRADGVERAAVWQGGQLRVLPVTDSLGGSARRVNAAGDVLLQYRPRGPADSAFVPARVLRADGALFPLGPWLWTRPPAGTPPNPPERLCCAVAADLSDTRVAVAAGQPVSGLDPAGVGSVTFDVAAGRQVDTVRAALALVNGRGQLLGTVSSGGLYNTVSLRAIGFVPPARPLDFPAAVCDRVGRYSITVPVGLDDAGNVVARWCGLPTHLSPAGSVWLDRYLGPRLTTLRLSARGGVVAALDSAAGALYLWRAETRRAARVALDGPWRVTGLAGVTPDGVIAARAVGAAGRAAAVLLTPTAR